jgi:hypothetical protein
MVSGKRLLIIEEEGLIALDIQLVLEEGFDAQAVLVPDYNAARKLANQFVEFDLAIVTPPRPDSGDIDVADGLVGAGVAIVVCSGSRVSFDGTCFAGVPVVCKPFTDDDVMNACRMAWEMRPR